MAILLHSHRLVASERVGGKVRQRTLLNLGSEFPLPREQWGGLCARIEEILSGQLPLAAADPAVERLAEKLAANLVARGDVVPQGPDRRPEALFFKEMRRGVSNLGRVSQSYPPGGY